jgi:hypothetical protein
MKGSAFASGAVISILLFCGAIYAALFFVGCGGYGYAGYGGYHRGPSFWYFGGVSTYHDKSVRSGSASGPSVKGGGTKGGK